MFEILNWFPFDGWDRTKNQRAGGDNGKKFLSHENPKNPLRDQLLSFGVETSISESEYKHWLFSNSSEATMVSFTTITPKGPFAMEMMPFMSLI